MTRVALKKKAKRPLTPNSVGEAMLFGCPAVSSCVGSVPDMLEHGREGVLYQASAQYMLAWYAECVFRDDELAMRFSKPRMKRPRGRTTGSGTCMICQLTRQEL